VIHHRVVVGRVVSSHTQNLLEKVSILFPQNEHSDLVTDAEVFQNLRKRECKIGTCVRFRYLNNVQEHCDWLPGVFKVDCNCDIGLVIW
jgi:hypothetical protein